MKTISFLYWFLALASSALVATGQVAFNGTYTQDFDTLASSGNTVAWTDNSTLPGWYGYRADGSFPMVFPTYCASGESYGGIHSFGDDSDRAFGSFANTSTDIIYFGLRLTNSTGSEISSLDIDYTAEQWRVGSTGSVNNRWNFQYSLNATSVQDASATWVAVSSLGFDSIIDTAADEGILDGNDVAKNLSVSGSVALSWQNGNDVWLRWIDVDDVSWDAGMGIDNLTVSSVPEPAGFAALMGLGILTGAATRRRRRD